MRKFTILGAAIVAVAFCSNAHGQVMSYITFLQPDVAIEKQIDLERSVLASSPVATQDVAAKQATTVPARLPQLENFQIVGYDNCDRPIYRQSLSMQAKSLQAVPAAILPKSSAAKFPVRPQAIANRSTRDNAPAIDTVFWDDLLSNVDAPLESD